MASSLEYDWLPFSSPLDPNTEPPTSIDPLGLTTPAERLAELLVPGFTVRTWRARLLTFCAITTYVGSAVVKRMNNREDMRLPAMLAFERMFVASIERAERKIVDGAKDAAYALPGIGLARRAAGRKEPLTRNNFLKGQAVNGPTGVNTRLAKNLGILNSDKGLGASALDLLDAWAADEGLNGFLQADVDVQAPGAVWLNDVVRAVTDLLSREFWPTDGKKIWDQLFLRLRPDGTGRREAAYLRRLLERDAGRHRLFGLLRDEEVLKIRAEAENNRGAREQVIMQDGVLERLDRNGDDASLRLTIVTIERYERLSGMTMYAFNSLLWGLKKNGRVAAETLISLAEVRSAFEKTRKALPKAIAELDQSIKELKAIATPAALAADLESLRDCLDGSLISNSELLNALLRRHKTVQKAKRKGEWIDNAESLTLMPGFGVDDLQPFDGTYLHPFRITNAYGVLGDLGLVKGKESDGQQVQ